jgi:hypothetical protein
MAPRIRAAYTRMLCIGISSGMKSGPREHWRGRQLKPMTRPSDVTHSLNRSSVPSTLSNLPQLVVGYHEPRTLPRHPHFHSHFLFGHVGLLSFLVCLSGIVPSILICRTVFSINQVFSCATNTPRRPKDPPSLSSSFLLSTVSLSRVTPRHTFAWILHSPNFLTHGRFFSFFAQYT